MKRSTILQLNQLITVIILWTIIGLIESALQFSLMRFLQLDPIKYDIAPGVILNVISSFFAGVIGGSFLVFAWNRWLRSMSYGRALISIFLSFTMIFILIYLIMVIIIEAFNFYPESREDTIIKELYLNSIPILVQYTKWLLIGLLTLIMLQVNDKYGPGVFKDFILGRYFHPKNENRVFMFLDLKGSTSIAEQLGEGTYFSFLRDSFETLTPAMIESGGDVYQYVGDEMVISWIINKRFNAQNCINGYFRMQELLDSNPKFETKYGIKPFFKAGLHGGSVMAGEMGVIKREIAYSGDVLNTTARIQAKCNEFNASLLISSYVKEKLNGPENYLYKLIGNIELRGKKEALELFKVTMKSNS